MSAARCPGNKTKWPPNNMQIIQVCIKYYAYTTCLIIKIKLLLHYLNSVRRVISLIGVWFVFDFLK